MNFDDITGRCEHFASDEEYLSKFTTKSVLLTGGAGSIGSTICDELLKLSPKLIVILDNSEYGLFLLQDRLNSYNCNIKIVFKLGSINDTSLLNSIMNDYNIDTVFHAAAYKHVPLLEQNKMQAFENNVIGTERVLRASAAGNVKSFTLISTDKAVRPTNVMGATKRIAELLTLYGSFFTKSKTSVSVVRFGNVIGSSGSVVPIFERQIAEGGPVTVTDKEVTRYFMSIQEAANLVIRASTIGRDGNIFHLDMGKPIKIIDLAKRMIEQKGLSFTLEKPQSKNEIQILVTGLRDGEKLFEELLINGEVRQTAISKIAELVEQPPKLNFAEFQSNVNAVYKNKDEALLNDLLQNEAVNYHSLD